MEKVFAVREEVSEERFDEMLCVLPPERMSGGAFLVGEPYDHNSQGQERFDLYYQEDGRFFYGGLLTTKEFDSRYPSIYRHV